MTTTRPGRAPKFPTLSITRPAPRTSRNAPRCLLVQFNKGELGRAVDGHEQVKLALLGADFGDVDMEEADRVALELGALRLVTVGVGQPRDAVALQAAMQR